MTTGRAFWIRMPGKHATYPPDAATGTIMKGENVDKDRPSDHSIQRARRVRCSYRVCEFSQRTRWPLARRVDTGRVRRPEGTPLPGPGSAETI